MESKFRMASTKGRGIWLTVIASVLFGVNGSVAADLLGSFPAGNTAQVRSILAALVLGGLAYRSRATRHGGHLIGLAALGIALAAVTVSFFVAIDRLGVGPGVTIQFTGPILVLAWQRLVRRQAVPGSAWGAATVALVGVAVVSRVWEAETLDPGGLAAAGVAAVMFAAYLLGSGYLGRFLPTLSVAAYGFAFSALSLLAVFPVTLPPAEPRVLVEIGWLVILGTVVPFLLEVEALKLTDAGTVGIVATLEPVVATVVAWAWLGQLLTGWQIAGAATVVIAIAIVQYFTGGEGEPTPIA
jgi:drug/metabolite transporter (DMT)-like permease